MSDNSVIIADLVIKGIPDNACISSFGDWLKLLQQYARIEVPSSISNAIVSREQPSENDRGKVWYRVDNSGSFVGIYLFSGLIWHKVYPVDGEVKWILGDSREPPDGWQLIDENNPNVSPSEVNVFKALYIPDPTQNWYIYFAATFKGF